MKWKKLNVLLSKSQRIQLILQISIDKLPTLRYTHTQNKYNTIGYNAYHITHPLFKHLSAYPV